MYEESVVTIFSILLSVSGYTLLLFCENSEINFKHMMCCTLTIFRCWLCRFSRESGKTGGLCNCRFTHRSSEYNIPVIDLLRVHCGLVVCNDWWYIVYYNYYSFTIKFNSHFVISVQADNDNKQSLCYICPSWQW